MKKISNKYTSLMCLLTLSLGTSAWSQGPGGHGGGGWGGPGGHQFNGPDTGIQRIGQQPVMNTGCGQQYSQPAQSALLSACVAGGTAAMQTAQRLATQQGRNDGFRTGYAWGLRSGIDSTSSDPAQLSAGQLALNAQSSPQAIQDLSIADQAGASAGAAQGTANGDQEAVGRFHAAIDTGAMPSQAVAPTDYAKYNAQYSSPYSNPYAQTVGAIQSELDILNSGQIDPGQVSFYSNGYDSGIFGNSPQFRPGDFYVSSGRYGFNSSQDAGAAFNMYISRGGFNHSDYDRLGSVQIITGYTTPPAAPAPAPVAPAPVAPAPVAPAPGPVTGGPGHGGGAGGNGGGGHAGPGAPAAPAAPTAPVVAAPAPAAPQPIYTTYNLKQIYQDSFIRSYSQFASYYYNDAYNDILNDGTNAGYYAGAQVGEKLAFQTGIVNAYNAQFRQREGSAFVIGAGNLPGYNASFNAQFATEYTNYATHPQIGVDSFSIVGIRNDGIVEPNEAITASYTVHNYGGVDATLPVTLEGDVTGAAQASVVVTKLTTSHQSGSLGATIASTVASQSNANVVLDVNGSRIPLVQYVTNQIIPSPGTFVADMPHGTVAVTLPLQNVSTANSYDTIKYVVTDNVGHSQTFAVGFLAGGQTYNIPMNDAGLNPLDLIDAKITIQVQAILGSVVVGQATMAIPSNDRYNMIAQAFEVAAQGTDTALQAALSDRIYSTLMVEAPKYGPLDNYSKDQGSLILAIVQLKKSHPQNATTLAAYKALATKLNPVIAAMHAAHGGFLGIKPANQKYFEAQLALLNSN